MVFPPFKVREQAFRTPHLSIIDYGLSLEVRGVTSWAKQLSRGWMHWPDKGISVGPPSIYYE